MAIGVDMDEVIFPLLENHCIFLNKTYGLKLNCSMFSNYNFWEHYGATKEEAIDDFIQFTSTQEYDNVLPIEGAKEAMSQLKQLDNLYIITSRTSKIKDKTEKWIDQHFQGLFSDIYFANNFYKGEYTRVSKRELCKNNHVSLLLEDHLDYALEVSNDIPVILIDQPWNQKMPINTPNIYRVKDCRDAAAVARRLLKK